MNYICIFFGLCTLIIKSESINSKQQFMSLTKHNTSEQKIWNLTLEINFPKSLPSLISRQTGTNVNLKCEAVMKFTRVEKYTKQNEKIETSLEEFPREYNQTLMQNVKLYWLKDKKRLKNVTNNNNAVGIKTDIENGRISSILRITNLQKQDEGNYTCVIKHSHEKKHVIRLEVKEDKLLDEIPTYKSLFPDSLFTESNNDKATTTFVTNAMSVNGENEPAVHNHFTHITVAPQSLKPICQEYVGTVCSMHLKGQFVYIPYNVTQNWLEEKLQKALQVTKYSKDISSNCEGYAVPSLCYSTFPICRDPFVTNDHFLKEAKKILFLQRKSESEGEDELKIVFENLPEGGLPSHLDLESNLNISLDTLNYRHNSTILKRVCKQDCEILENELCQTEYAIAKRHPHIGQQLTLEECHDLPEDDPDCLKIGIGSVMVSDDECYWENGTTYLGRVNVAKNGMPCIEWSKQMRVRVSDYPELAGRHSYCRNPGGLLSQPWCIVDKDGKTDNHLCDIPKCAHKIWIYIVTVFFLITSIIIGFIICVCCKNKRKKNATTLMDINLPNADKNIYGNSRLNSPIEMSDLLSNQTLNNPANPSRNVRGNGILRIPQFTLSQIRFLEELGEGAFGKVYKGALNRGGETLYVAVKALKENASAKTQADFRREIDLISELRHDNIVCIVGVALREEPLCMLFEFMARGDLHEFLMGRAPPSGKGLPAMRLLNIAHNIASGMHYLASHHYVHRDLAARNCLVSDDFVVKISDFGLSRDIYSSDYYRVQSKSLLPVRWMPPESILYGKFTTESDIWSYGVVLWEIYSYGLQPYYGYSNQEVISMVRGGELLACPTNCPPAMYILMRECWKHTPQRRPNFEEIVARLHTWIELGGCPEIEASESSSACSHRQAGSSKDLQERAPLLPPHCSSSNGSLATGSLKKLSIAGSSAKVTDDNCSTCSEIPPALPKHNKKGSCASLTETEKQGAKDTVIRIPNAQFGNDI